MIHANSATVHVVSRDTESIRRISQLLEGRSYAVGEAGVSDFLHGLDHLQGLCVMLCGGLPASEKLALVGKVRAERPDLPVIVLTPTATLPFAVEAMRLGAADVLHEPPLPEELEASLIRLSRSGHVPDTNGHGHKVLANGSGHGLGGFISQLTPREGEVLRLLLAGHQNKSIGHKLGISERTVEVHRARMMRKLGVTSFAVLIRKAIDAGVEPMVRE